MILAHSHRENERNIRFKLPKNEKGKKRQR